MSKRSLKLGLLGGALLLAGALGLSAVGRARSKAELRAYKASLVARGEKLTIDELAPRPLDEARQAGRDLLQAAQKFRAGVVLPHNAPGAMKPILPGKARVAWQQPELRFPDTTNTWAQLAADLETDQEVLKQVHGILKGPLFDFALDYRPGPALSLPHLAVIMRTAQRLSSATLSHLHEGRLEAARASLEALLAVAEVLRDEPLLFSQQVRDSVVAIAFATTWEALQADGWTDAQLAALQRRWEALEFVVPTRRAADMERAIGVHTFERTRQSKEFRRQFFDGGGSATQPAWPSDATELPGFLFDTARAAAVPLNEAVRERRWLNRWSYADERKFLQSFKAVPPAWQSVQEGHAFAAACQRISTDMDEFERQCADVNRYRLTGMLTPPLAQLFRSVGDVEVQRELGIAAIALKRYHLRYEALAPSLAALMPESLLRIPRDVMDGGQLRYRLNPDGTWILYSVGENGVDDGGDPASPHRPRAVEPFVRGLDVVWPQPATPEEVARVEAAPPGGRQRMTIEMLRRYGLIPRE